MSVTEMSVRTHSGTHDQMPWQGVLEALDEVVLRSGRLTPARLAVAALFYVALAVALVVNLA